MTTFTNVTWLKAISQPMEDNTPSEFLELMSPRFKGLLKTLLDKYASQEQPANEQIRKALKGFEREAIIKVKEIRAQVSTQIEICELNLLQVERNKIKTLLD